MKTQEEIARSIKGRIERDLNTTHGMCGHIQIERTDSQVSLAIDELINEIASLHTKITELERRHESFIESVNERLNK